MSDAISGVVVVDKEPGWTSHDVVARCRRLIGIRRVGHAGTLDPDATGVLLVGVGTSTRLLRYLGDLTKTYTGEVVLGTTTSSLDASGEVTGHFDMADVTLEQLRSAALGLSGDIEQIPPMVSAIKIGGERLHALARQGIEIDRPPRPVTVHRFDIDATDEPGIFKIVVECSSGTYIRVLAADLGAAVGGGAHLRNLRRNAIGDFTEAEARTLEHVGPEAVMTPAQALRHLDQIRVSAEVATLISRGLPLDRVPVGANGSGPWALIDDHGRLLAVYEATDTDRIKASVVLAAAGGPLNPAQHGS